MLSLIFFIVVALIIVAAVTVLKMKQEGSSNDKNCSYSAKKVMTEIEQTLYFRLVEALPDHIIFPQVQLSRFVTPKPYKCLNHISKKSIDFLICFKDSSVYKAIELDDSTHSRTQNMKRDETKNQALSSAKIPLIRWNVKNMPDVAAIRKAILPGK